MRRLRRARGHERPDACDNVEVEVEIVETGFGPQGTHDTGDRLPLLGVGVRYGNRQVVRNVTLRPCSEGSPETCTDGRAR